ncbi:MAG TPA: hypothetical protein VNW92_07245 [Polyangiaceae bacterium]|nr:hypothetical protein [Polyangiaceae bacterium]
MLFRRQAPILALDETLETETLVYMAKMPAWKDHPKVDGIPNHHVVCHQDFVIHEVVASRGGHAGRHSSPKS